MGLLQCKNLCAQFRKLAVSEERRQAAKIALRQALKAELEATRLAWKLLKWQPTAEENQAFEQAMAVVDAARKALTEARVDYRRIIREE